MLSLQLGHEAFKALLEGMNMAKSKKVAKWSANEKYLKVKCGLMMMKKFRQRAMTSYTASAHPPSHEIRHLGI